MKTLSNKSANMMKVVAVSLIVLASFTGIANGANSNKEAIEAAEIKSAMTFNHLMDGNDEVAGSETVEDKNLSLDIQSWISSNAFWSETENDEEFESEATLPIESWMNDNSFWNGNESIEETENEQQVSLAIQSWMKTGAYWNETETIEEQQFACNF